jgi:hypothetical protein
MKQAKIGGNMEEFHRLVYVIIAAVVIICGFGSLWYYIRGKEWNEKGD